MNLKDLYYQDSIDKQLVISYGNKQITNVDIDSESMELEESLCSENRLTFGSCEASVFKIRVRNHVEPLSGVKIEVRQYLNGDTANACVFGRYTVESDRPSANRTYRDIIAYDDMYRIINTDVAAWYNSLTFPLTVKQFRAKFLLYMGIGQEDVTLVNDDLTLTKSIQPSEISGKDVITAICEINGCFGHIGRDGKMHYIRLTPITETLYPSDALYPSSTRYPSHGESDKYSRNRYISCTYEDFKTPKITKLQIRQEENDIGAIVGVDGCSYIVEDNFLCYGLGAAELKAVAQKLLSVISKVSPYYPYSCKAIGNPCVEVGGIVSIYEKGKFIESYLLNRVLKGIQALKDALSAGGQATYDKDINKSNRSIIRLKGKINTLTRTVEETRSEIEDIEAGLSSSITQTADKIELEVSRATTAEGKLSGSITQTAEKIELEVSRATTAEEKLSSSITQTAEKIELKVSRGELSSQLSVESGRISISSNRFSLFSTNCTISEDGTLTAKNGNFTGSITSNSAKITGGEINIQSTSEKSVISIQYSGGYKAEVSGVGFFATYGYNKTSYVLGSGIRSGGSIISEAHIESGTSITAGTSLYTDAIYSKSVSGTIDLNSPVSFNQSTEFEIGKTHTFRGDVVMTASAKLGGSSGYLGFFGSGGSGRKVVYRLSVSSSLTAGTVANKVNELIDALKAYNLIS